MAHFKRIIFITFLVLLVCHTPSFQARKAFSKDVNAPVKVLAPLSSSSKHGPAMAVNGGHITMKIVVHDSSVPSPGAGN
ncbi:Uncharacterized protein TCM_031993 [Theobroma cacao]|uniref:Uncharacterized protein n=1 Tax=Theobroma cacao TaxID=3641 RepID=A0A061F7T3_THECC|nr:Uncharacterized protein TCM_031993 [Theobroma cacao]